MLTLTLATCAALESRTAGPARTAWAVTDSIDSVGQTLSPTVRILYRYRDGEAGVSSVECVECVEW